MFEKEAEEATLDLYGSADDVYGKEDYKQGFKDGAESGYNKAKEDADKMKSRFLELCNLKDMRIKELEKANEWHYIKDGNLPKENENVLIYSNRANHIGFYRNGFWFTNSDGCLEDDDIEVIAWKEIVLPELKESE